MGSKRLGILREELEGLTVVRPELRGLTTPRDYRLTTSDFFTSGGRDGLWDLIQSGASIVFVKEQLGHSST
jgi:hypothetical protein